MPRYIVPSYTPSPKHAKLVKKLLQELKGDQVGVQPLILEEHVKTTDSRHVRVIWDAWDDLNEEERALIILEAYAELEGEEASSKITIAEGLTPSDAVALGLLPFKVVSERKRDDRIPVEEYQKAFAAEAKNTVLGPKAKALRFARLEDAREAKDRLKKELPGSYWAVVHEVMFEP